MVFLHYCLVFLMIHLCHYCSYVRCYANSSCVQRHTLRPVASHAVLALRTVALSAWALHSAKSSSVAIFASASCSSSCNYLFYVFLGFTCNVLLCSAFSCGDLFVLFHTVVHFFLSRSCVVQTSCDIATSPDLLHITSCRDAVSCVLSITLCTSKTNHGCYWKHCPIRSGQRSVFVLLSCPRSEQYLMYYLRWCLLYLAKWFNDSE